MKLLLKTETSLLKMNPSVALYRRALYSPTLYRIVNLEIKGNILKLWS